MDLKEYKMLLGKYSLLSSRYNLWLKGHQILYPNWIDDDESSLSCKELKKRINDWNQSRMNYTSIKK